MIVSLYAFNTIKPLEDWLQDDRCIAPIDIIKARLDEGWAAEKAIATAPTEEDLNPKTKSSPMRRRSYGRRYAAFNQVLTSREWAESKYCKISGNSADRANLIRLRIREGWSVEDAVTLPQRKQNTRVGRLRRVKKQYTAWDEEKSLLEWVEDDRCQVTAKTRQAAANIIRHRIIEYGWSTEKAIETPTRNHGGRGGIPPMTYTAFNKTLTAVQWAEEEEVQELGISPTAIRERIKRGWSIERALTTPPKKTGRKPKETSHA